MDLRRLPVPKARWPQPGDAGTWAEQIQAHRRPPDDPHLIWGDRIRAAGPPQLEGFDQHHHIFAHCPLGLCTPSCPVLAPLRRKISGRNFPPFEQHLPDGFWALDSFRGQTRGGSTWKGGSSWVLSPRLEPVGGQETEQLASSCFIRQKLSLRCAPCSWYPDAKCRHRGKRIWEQVSKCFLSQENRVSNCDTVNSWSIYRTHHVCCPSCCHVTCNT